jgi:hypothetical protein
MEADEILSQTDLASASINPEIAREAVAQVERRLADTLETKKGFEQKASTLFSVYVALAVALFGVGGTLYKATSSMAEVLPFLIVGFVFMCGALLFALALRGRRYGELGTSPTRWLERAVITGDARVLPLMQAYLVHDYIERIKASEQSNKCKAALIMNGIWVGFGATTLLLAFAFYR